MQPLISIVVPCYNVEDFLDFTMNSVIKQSYENLEIILINDGSTDSTGKGCEKWAKKDQRIKVHHQENGGLSHARNVGISMSSGQYISFVDADDRIHEKMIEKLYRLLISNNAQMSSCLWNNIYDDSMPTDELKVYTKTFSTKDAIESALIGKELSCGATGKLYEQKLFDDILFPLNVTIEDAYIIMELILQCKRVAFINQGLYHYYHREGSIMHSDFSLNDFNVIKAHQHNKELISKVYPDLHFLAEQRLSWAYLYVYDKLIQSERGDKALEKELRKEVLVRFKYIKEGGYFNKARVLAVFVLFLSPYFYKKLVDYRSKRYIAHES